MGIEGGDSNAMDSSRDDSNSMGGMGMGNSGMGGMGDSGMGSMGDSGMGN